MGVSEMSEKQEVLGQVTYSGEEALLFIRDVYPEVYKDNKEDLESLSRPINELTIVEWVGSVNHAVVQLVSTDKQIAVTYAGTDITEAMYIAIHNYVELDGV